MTDLYADVVHQTRAVEALRAAATRPVHAYLLVGPPGSGASRAAVAFAASLLCPDGGDGTCETCRRVLAGLHPDVAVVERDGPAITIDTARAVAVLAQRSPREGSRRILVLSDFHLVKEAGPALLKTIEEPPASTFFVILADDVPPELVTIASRCVRIDFDQLTSCHVHELLAGDRGFEGRRAAWRDVPGRLDGTGAIAAQIAEELVGQLEGSAESLRMRQATELADLERANARAAEVNGKVGRTGRGGLKAGVKELEERHRRELRRQRTDELRAGLAILAEVYRDRAARGGRPGAEALTAVQIILQLGADLAYNPGELLLLQGLLVRLGRFPLGRVPA